MLFEGSEKKFELFVEDVNLRTLPLSFWKELVQKSQAAILSHFSNEHFDAYLLSESSLFVCSDRCIMITCGQTRLVDAALFFISQYTKNIRAFFYQRKNELFPHLQSSDFTADVEGLRYFLDGNIFELGNSNGHYTHIFYYEHPIFVVHDDVTFELLMYGISPKIRSLFSEENSINEKRKCIHKLFSNTNLLSDFQIDDYIFEPYGYSVNALLKDKYFTIHITPQEECSYISFESNLDINSFDELLFHKLYQVFQPESYDILLFQLKDNRTKNIQGTDIHEFDTKLLGDSYQVHFYHKNINLSQGL